LRLRDERRSRSFDQIPIFAYDIKGKVATLDFFVTLKNSCFSTESVEQRPTLNWRIGPLLIGPRRAEVDPMKRPNALASAPGRSRGPAAIQTTMAVLIWSIGVSKNHAAGGANPERVSSRGQLNAPQFSIAQRCYL